MRPSYRVWDIQAKKMIYNAESTYDNYPVEEPSFGVLLDCPDFYDVMQYIGIKDVNDKKVYEKDIVKITLAQTEEALEGVVFYNEEDAIFLVNTFTEGYFTFMSSETKSVEVLGNTHENKELINETTKV